MTITPNRIHHDLVAANIWETAYTVPADTILVIKSIMITVEFGNELVAKEVYIRVNNGSEIPVLFSDTGYDISALAGALAQGTYATGGTKIITKTGYVDVYMVFVAGDIIRVRSDDANAIFIFNGFLQT